MFPSQGYFYTANCPDFVNGKCNRAYCHFYHNEKLQKFNQNSNQSSNSSNAICDNLTFEKQTRSGRCGELHKNYDSSTIIRSNTDILKDRTRNTSAQNESVSEASTSNASNKSTSDILTHIIGEAVKKVLCESSTTLNSLALDPNDFIKSLDASSIVSKAAREISSVHLQNASEKRLPKLYLPPPGTPSYKPTPISELNNNKYNKPKDPKLNFEAVEEYTPTPINCKDKDEDDEITDFSSDGDDDANAKSEFDMLEEVLVEKLSSDPARNKAIQKRKKALRKLSTHISSKPSNNDSKNLQERPHVENLVPHTILSDSLSNSDSVFDPPSPVFTSSADTSVSYSLEQMLAKNTDDSSVDSVSHDDIRLPEMRDTKVSLDGHDKVPISSTHNLLPQIAELARPNVKSWTPIAKVGSISSVEKMLEQLDRIDNVDKNPSQKNNLNLNILDTKTTQNASETQESLNIEDKENNVNNKLLNLEDKESNVNNSSKGKEASKADELNCESIISKNNCSGDSCNTLKDKRKNSTDERTKLSEEVNSKEGHSRKRSLSSDNSNSDKCKRKRSSSSSRKKRKHKRKYSSMDDSSESDYSDSRRDSSEDRHSKKRKKHKKHKGRKAKDHKKRNKRDKSKSHRKKRSREKKYHSDSSESPESSDTDPKDHTQSNGNSEGKNSALLTPDQIKQEKIEVDLSIVKIEKAKDSVPNKELKKITNTPSLDDKVRDKLSSASSEVKVQSGQNSENNTCKPVPPAKENNVLHNIKGSNEKIVNCQSRKSHAEINIPKGNIIKSSDKTKPIVSKNLQSSSESKAQSNPIDFNVETESSVQKSGKAISLRNKLENYTSSLLAKVSDSSSGVLRSRTHSSESSKTTSVKQNKSNSLNSENNQKDLKSSQKDSSDIISSPKPKSLKEFSIFEGLKDISDSKQTSKSSPNSKKSSKKPEDKSLSKKNSRDKTLHSSLESKYEGSSKSKENEKEKSKISLGIKSSSHSSQREKYKQRDRHSSRESSSKSTKNRDDKGKTSSNLSSTKHKESSRHSRSKDSKDSKRSGDSKSRKDSVSEFKEKKLDKNKKSHISPSIASPTGTDSPIPDLSALDEIPKEDWDQLLSSSNDKIGNSDSDEEIDTQTFPEVEDLNGDEEEEEEEEDINDPRVLEECMKVFSEYDPVENMASTVSKKESSKEDKATEDIIVPTKKNRVAYSGAAGNLIAKSKPLVKPHRKTPAEVMLERYNKLKEEEVQLQKKLEIQRKELAKHGRFPPSGLAISSSSVSSTSDPLPALQAAISSTTGKKRIAIAPKNVTALLKSKELLQTKPTSSSNKILVSTTSSANQQTPAMTHAKGAKRIAHTPNLETIERPIISTEDGTKVPQNIRQRYLNCFIDETLKFCDGDSHSYNVALAEESICHKRATTRMVYLNLAVNVLKKLRASQISEAAQELLLNDPKYKDTRENKIVSQPVVSSSSSSSVSKKKFVHPVNPNHRTVSHYSVITSGGQKGTWSIQKPKKSLPANINDYLTGIKFYKCLKKYILNIEQLGENGFPLPDPSVKGKAILKKINSRKRISPSENERYCDRCSTLYKVDKWGLPLSNAPCLYHWGRAYKCRGFGGMESKYSCCQGDNQSEGCCIGTTHVSENFSPDTLTSYVRTIPKSPNKEGDFGIYALDCEMCYTTAGSELTRITVVDTNCKSIYETLVKPDNPIIDYNTRFSGITEEDMEGVSVRLRDVQAALLTRFSDKTILMGHSLESDFSALKIIHETVVDTSLVFPHKLGPPFKRALRNLASEYLAKIIQNDEGGHDSAEDANTCMELMKWKIKEDLKGQF